MERNRSSSNAVRRIVLSLFAVVLVMEKPHLVRAAGEPVTVSFDTVIMEEYYRIGQEAHRNGDYVQALMSLYALQVLYARVRTSPIPAFEELLAGDIQSARSVLYEGLNARNKLPFVVRDLQACTSRPQCQGAEGLLPDVTPPRPRTNLPPTPPRFR
jgi:hypothetical protein